ncbi:serine hydrolase [Saccharothrix sp. 6-C]|uniref:Beta-lactamase n=1 Tax=Saccharothrix texasensis TaxID=103734 RepID=A0A3N1HFM7_9PSEU|nr:MULTISPECIES: serine hydrolase [Saccharothrix]QQQ74630.1 serine hydrolase [Saccharothrix sp. 6-C]ROP41293.1 beta-lactamase class A [Saccharothrix texasensis]
MNINRRFALGLGSAAAASAVLGSTAGTAQAQTTEAEWDAVIPTTAEQARRKISLKYAWETARARGTWSSYIGVADPDGVVKPAVEAEADRVVEAYSVNKVAVALAVLDKVDRGLITLDQRVEVTSDIVIRDTDGIFHLDGGYPSSVTVGHALANLLTVSDNTAVRLCGLVVPALELNEILRAKGFVHTQVVPVANPNRFYLGTTTARETFTMLRRLAAGELLSAASTQHLFTVLRSLTSFTDGIRLNLTSAERLNVATKAGWEADGRNEAGIVFDVNGKPIITYALFASGQYSGNQAVNEENYGATHPALRARAALGRTLYDSVLRITANTPRTYRTPQYRPVNGG